MLKQVVVQLMKLMFFYLIKLSPKRLSKKSHKRFNAHAEHVPSDENDLIISSINALDLGWKADTCKLQKHHAQYGEHCEALNLAQT